MASNKFYAYYIRGKQIALIQHDFTLGTGQTLGQPGLNDVGARGDVLWKSPTEAIAKGLEIEYAYSPRYTLEGTGTEGTDFHKFIGWGSNGAELLLFTYSASSQTDLSSLFAADDYIVISGSSRWNGLHQVKSTGTSTGILTLKTKCNIKPSTITVDTRYVVVNSSSATTSATGLNTEYSAAADFDAKDGLSVVNIYKAYRDFSYVLTDVNVLNDETDEIDLPDYLAKALVYYVKAKVAEDRMDLEQKEYNMREFKRLLERNESSKIWGARRIGTDETAIK